MAIIEERAYRKAFRCMRTGGLTTREACIEMAKEQREIDIKRAQEVHCAICKDCFSPLQETCECCDERDKIYKAMMDEKI